MKAKKQKRVIMELLLFVCFKGSMAVVCWLPDQRVDRLEFMKTFTVHSEGACGPSSSR